MATRCVFENSNEIGVFAALTNAYCLTGKRAASDGDGSEVWLPMYPDALGILTLFCFVVSLFIVCKALGDLRISIRFSSRNFPNTSP